MPCGRSLIERETKPDGEQQQGDFGEAEEARNCLSDFDEEIPDGFEAFGEPVADRLGDVLDGLGDPVERGFDGFPNPAPDDFCEPADGDQQQVMAEEAERPKEHSQEREQRVWATLSGGTGHGAGIRLVWRECIPRVPGGWCKLWS